MTLPVAAVGEVTARYNDAQTMLLIGKTALARSMAMDQYAFPDIGVPHYSQSDRSSIAASSTQSRARRAAQSARQSPANAVGLMRYPGSGRDTAKRISVA